MGEHGEVTIRGKRYRWHTVTDDEVLGKLWRYGRLYLNFPERKHAGQGSAREMTFESEPELNLQWSLERKPTEAWSLGAEIATMDGQDDEDLSVSLHVAHVGVYMNADKFRLTRWFANRFGGQEYPYARSLSVRLHHGAVHWCTWMDDSSWSRSTPKWRQGHWSIERTFWPREVDVTPLDDLTRAVLVPMPEGAYPAVVTFERRVMRRGRLGSWLKPEVITTYTLEFDKAIPFPGKGENSWDCGDDGISSMSGPGETAAGAVGHAVAAVYRNRLAYGSSEVFTPQG